MDNENKIPETYFKIGEHAHLFYDSVTGLNVSSHRPGKLDGSVKLSKKVNAAVGNGHIIKIDADEYDKLMDNYYKLSGEKSDESKSESPEKVLNLNQNETTLPLEVIEKFKAMSKEELLVYIKEEYDLDEAKTKEITSKNKNQILNTVIEWETEAMSKS